MKRNYSVDTLKCLCAILVVFLHVSTPLSGYYIPITRCAVPCFFIISGYLMYAVDNMDLKINKSLKKIFIITMWSTALFAIMKLSIAYKNDDFSFLSLTALCNMILFNENPFGFHLWYLMAYLYVLLIVKWAYRKRSLNILYIAIPFLLLTDLVFGKYSLLIWGREFNYIYMRNFAFVGIPYFTIGMLLKKYSDKILSCTRLNTSVLSGGGNNICNNIIVRKIDTV